MSRLDKIIALLLVSITAGCAWLLSQSATVTLVVAFSASALLGMLLSPHATAKPRGEGSTAARRRPPTAGSGRSASRQSSSRSLLIFVAAQPRSLGCSETALPEAVEEYCEGLACFASSRC